MTLAEALESHTAADALEAAHLEIVRRFVATHPDPFDRNIADAHCTGSAFVVSHDGRSLLFVYHRKLSCWLQPGGHGEPGETAGETVALREAREETGIDALELHASAPRPFDVDVHRIPSHRNTPSHDHLDLRYVVVAPPAAEPSPSLIETRGARWFKWDEIEAMPLDRPSWRALNKLERILLASGVDPDRRGKHPTTAPA